MRKLSEYGGLNAKDLDVISPALKTFPYDAARLKQTIVRRYHYQDTERVYAFSAGSAEAILESSNELWLHGHIRKLTAADKKFIRGHIDTAEAEGKQTIALAYKAFAKKTATDEPGSEKVEHDMVWLGVITLEHGLREEVSLALTEAHEAGLSIVALATEHTTAKAVAHVANMQAAGGKVSLLNSAELAKFSDSKLTALLHRGGMVLTNISAADKLRLAQVAQNAGYNLAITGSSFQDVPALSQANTALAVDVSSPVRYASDFSLQDPSFGNLMLLATKARALHVKLRHALFALLTANLAKLTVLGISLFALIAFDVPVAIALVQLL
ncbi:MAG TPA: hypothetical protein VFT58_04110, partial [Nitrososphaera sp.]|nr:hypothetical protein [Nitrososphaera sp.]